MITIILIALLFILIPLAPVYMFLHVSDEINVCTNCMLIQAIIFKIHTPEIKIVPAFLVKYKEIHYDN